MKINGRKIVYKILYMILSKVSIAYRNSFMLGVIVGYLMPNISRRKIVKLTATISSNSDTKLNVDLMAVGVLLSGYLIPSENDILSHEDILGKCTKVDNDIIYYGDKKISCKQLNAKLVLKMIDLYPGIDISNLVKRSVSLLTKIMKVNRSTLALC